jgi:hypothetical protein
VDCWIGISRDGDRRVVRLAGRFGEAQVPDLLTACSEPGLVQVDLSELMSADVAGLDALQRVRARGAALVGVTGYIQMRLDAARVTPSPFPKTAATYRLAVEEMQQRKKVKQ